MSEKFGISELFCSFVMGDRNVALNTATAHSCKTLWPICRMRRLITYLAFFLTLQINCNGQSFFNFTDSVFEVGQIKRFQIIWDLSGSCPIRAESILVLDSIFDFLNNYKNIQVEVGASTDYRNDSLWNVEYSNRRAKCIKDYFIEKGIDPIRVEHKGYGEYNPIIVDTKVNEQYPFLKIGQKLTEEYIKKLDTVEKQETANMLNRRTEIKIIDKTNRP